MATGDVDKTEKPTPRRREKARKEGSVAQSKELNSGVLLLMGTLAMVLFGGSIASGIGFLGRYLLLHSGTMPLSMEIFPVYMWKGAAYMLVLLIPFFAFIMAAGILSNVGQVGFMITTKPLKPKLSRLSPMKGIKKYFSPRPFVELGKSVLKLSMIGIVVYLAIRSEFDHVLELSALTPPLLIAEIGRMIFLIFLKATIAIMFIAALDYAYTRYEHEKSLKMSKQEIKDESRQSEGDPKLKSKIRGIQLKAALRRMMKSVPKADVVITNPIHLAVALKYDNKKQRAPMVIAKGARRLAERIKDIARENDIPIVENPPLAQALYKMVEVNQEIPGDLYRAVAEILAYVYRLKRKFFGMA